MAELVVLIWAVWGRGAGGGGCVTNTHEIFQQNSFSERILLRVIITSLFFGLVSLLCSLPRSV